MRNFDRLQGIADMHVDKQAPQRNVWFNPCCRELQSIQEADPSFIAAQDNYPDVESAINRSTAGGTRLHYPDGFEWAIGS